MLFFIDPLGSTAFYGGPAVGYDKGMDFYQRRRRLWIRVALIFSPFIAFAAWFTYMQAMHYPLMPMPSDRDSTGADRSFDTVTPAEARGLF